jgi:ribosomal protein S18 acetylase RimI-like enzyme
MSTSIRPYQPSDLETCRALWRELTQRHRDIYGDPTIGGTDPGPHFDRHLAHPQLAGLWVAERNADIVGFCGLLVDGEEGEVEPIVVSSTFRSMGIGRELLDHVVEESKGRGLRFLSVRPVARNLEAISFFFDAGFRLLGRIELFMESPEPTQREWKTSITIHGNKFRF